MSTAILESPFLGCVGNSVDSPDYYTVFRTSGDSVVETVDDKKSTIRFHPISQNTSQKNARKTKSRVIRRFKGFLKRIDGFDAYVSLIEDDQAIDYVMPAKRFRDNDITFPNQPFQMDEVEVNTEEGVGIVGYSFLALASGKDAYLESVNFDEARKKKRALIFQKFGKA